MHKLKQLLLILILISSAGISQTQPEFIRGIDVSALTQILDGGGVYKSGGNVVDPLLLFRNNGVNYLRLRLWHTPPGGYNNLEKTLSLAIRAKNLGYKLLLDFHYSDDWADPSKQTKPAAWANISYDALRDSIYNYTYNTMLAFRNNNCLPNIVQVGNEIDGGILWNDGRVGGNYNTSQQWQRFASLLIKAIWAVKAIGGDSVKIMLHSSSGGDVSGDHPLFLNLEAYSVPYDIIGISFYPWWNYARLFNLPLIIANLMSSIYGRDVVIAETAYPFTLLWNDNTHNAVGLQSQLHPGYDATPAGQKAFLMELKRITASSSPGRTRGFFYWAPEWISAPSFGSPWENLALFDFTGEALPAMTAFDTSLTKVEPEPENQSDGLAISSYPNPFYESAKITYQLPAAGSVKLIISDVLGREVKILLNETKSAGSYTTIINAEALPGGVYFCLLTAGGKSAVSKMVLVR